jgi:hypothetical protein
VRRKIYAHVNGGLSGGSFLLIGWQLLALVCFLSFVTVLKNVGSFHLFGSVSNIFCSGFGNDRFGFSLQLTYVLSVTLLDC